MARIERLGSGKLAILAETLDEHRLCLDSDDRQRVVVLDDAYYPVARDHVILPDTMGLAAAARVKLAFEQAAQHHAIACRRRTRFRLIDG